MAVAFMFDAESFGQGEYDAVMNELTGDAGSEWAPPGLIAHLGGAKDGGGWRVVDVWESDDAANAFYGSDAFAPVRNGTANANLSMTPWPLHRLDVFKSAHQID